MDSLWAIALFLIGDCICTDNLREVTAKEGSCVKIRIPRRPDSYAFVPAYIVWLKDAVWNDGAHDYKGTVVYSQKPDKRSESSFTNRVSMTTTADGKTDELTIENLRLEDSGNFSCRFYEYSDQENKWSSLDIVSLKVENNLCQVNSTQPGLVQVNDQVSLRCSTRGSCDDSPKWLGALPTGASTEESNTDGAKTAILSFITEWSDNGKRFSCGLSKTNDLCATRNITLNVAHPPKETKADIDNKSIKEGMAVTFTCHSKGNPQPELLWFKMGPVGQVGKGEKWNLHDVQAKHAGSYFCLAKNELGSDNSTVVELDVKYAPKGVEIIPSKALDQITAGERFSLDCTFKSSNPTVDSYYWYKDYSLLGHHGQTLLFTPIQLKDTGSYECRASNSEGPARSHEVRITVNYGPRNTEIQASCCEMGMRAGQDLTLTCQSDALPEPKQYTWFQALTQLNGARTPGWTEFQAPSKTWTNGQALTLKQIQVSDAGEYMCQAKNRISAQNSSSFNVHVLYGPTHISLSMTSEVREFSLVNIRCTVESYPPSTLTLTGGQSLKSPLERSVAPSENNVLTASFPASVEDAGWYTCQASNSEGSDETSQELVVKFAPKNVRAKASPSGEVVEKTTLELSCEAQANPSAMSYAWFRLRGGSVEEVGRGQNMTFNMLSEVDAGMYFCGTWNTIGSGNSSIINVTVKYGPRKPVVVHNMTGEGQSVPGYPVALMCSSQSYPPIHSYEWYIQEDMKTARFLRAEQNLTIDPKQGGVYYCLVDNGLSSSSSDKIEIHFSRSSTHILIAANVCAIFIILIFIFVIVLVYRKRRKSQQSLQNIRSSYQCSSFLGSRNGTRETLVMDGIGEPQRSRESLSGVAAPPLDPQANQHDRHIKPWSSINTVYSALKIPIKIQKDKSPGPPRRERGGPTEESGIDYASLQFPGKRHRTGLEPEESSESIYSKVTKPRREGKEEEDAEYENVKGTAAGRRAREMEMETSEEDVCYSKISFEATDRIQGRSRGSSDSSDEDYSKVLYSMVKA